MNNVHHITPQTAPTNEDGVNLGKIVLVGVVSLVVFAISAVVAGLILHHDHEAYAKRGEAAQVAGLTKLTEVGIVDVIPFDADHRLEEWRAEKAKELSGYGWVDRKKGLIHIPVEEAMKQVIDQAAAGGTR